MNRIALQGVGKRYGSQWVLNSIDLALGRGECLGVNGASGAGKSTLIRLLARLEPSTSGSVNWGDRDARDLKGQQRLRRRSVQVVFQDSASALSPRRTVGQSLHEPLQTHQLRDRADRTNRAGLIGEWLERVGLEQKHLTRYPHQLSGGERQRVALVRSLLVSPDFLLADEPLSALDVVSKVELLALLRRLQHQQGFGLLIASHDLRVIKWLDRRAELTDGNLQWSSGIA